MRIKDPQYDRFAALHLNGNITPTRQFEEQVKKI